MSDHELHMGSDPSDLRHNERPTPIITEHVEGDHIGNDTQEPAMPRDPWHNDPEYFVPVEKFSRPVYDGQGERIGDEINHPHAQRPEFPGPSALQVSDQWRPDPQGLTWHFGNGFTPLVGLASTTWANLRDLPNVELRTIHAHLMEAVAQARNEMRERGMVVDF